MKFGDYSMIRCLYNSSVKDFINNDICSNQPFHGFIIQANSNTYWCYIPLTINPYQYNITIHNYGIFGSTATYTDMALQTTRHNGIYITIPQFNNSNYLNNVLKVQLTISK